MKAETPTSRSRLAHRCSGYTLLELLAVVSIIGILSSMGVVGLQSAVANARIKDAAFNVTAFMESAANEARRMNTELCVMRVNDQKLVTYKCSCDDSPLHDKVDSLILDLPNKFINNAVTGAEFKDAKGVNLKNWYTDGASFTPRAGLSAAPYQGYFAVQYGNKGLYAAALKKKSKNTFEPMMKFDEGSWFKL